MSKKKSQKPDVWMPLFIGDYLADTMHLSATENGAYLLLLMAAWLRDGELPDDDSQLCRLARCSNKEWKIMRLTISAFFKVEDGKWVQSRLAHELSCAKDDMVKRSEKAAKASKERWAKACSEHPPSISSSNAPEMLEQCPSPSPSIIKASISSSLRSEDIRAPRALPAIRPNDVDESVWQDFLALRKVKKAPLSATGLAGIEREAKKAGMTLEDALRECCSRGWVGFKSDWVEPKTYAGYSGTNRNKQTDLEARNQAAGASWLAKVGSES